MLRFLYAVMSIGLAVVLPGIVLAQPVSNFTSNTVAGCSPIIVQFTDQSTGTPTSWYWDLGNGTTTTVQNPSTTYLNPGTYTVSLTVTNSGGSDTTTRTNYITVYPSPTVSFYGDSTISCPPKTVSFTNTSIPGAAGTTTYLWDFGDGYTSTAANPVHTYSASGNFTVTLVVTNSNGCSRSLTKTSYIPVATKPSTSFTAASTTGCAYPFTANFSNTTTGAVSYEWSFGDGNTSTLQNPSHTYAASGTYTVRLISTSSLGCKDTLTKTSYITVNSLHAAMSISPSTICVNKNVHFTNTSSTGNVSWSFGDGGISNSTNPNHIYTDTGTYVVKVIAQNGSCYDTATQTITVNPLPVIQFTATTTDGCSVPFTTSFTNTSTNAVSYTWLFGDGGSSTLANPSHTYTSFGNYTVKLIATNAAGCTDTFTRTSYIKVQTPTDSIATNTFSGCAPISVTFTAIINTNIPVSNYSWNFGDGSPAVGCSSCSTQTHTYTTAGTYIATLTYTTGTGCVFTKQKTITVSTKPTASFTATPLTPCPGQTVSFTNTSTGASSYYWDFGGSASTQVNPTYTFVPGSYTIILIADNNGCKDTLVRNNYINVPLPRALFSATYSCSNRLAFTFVDNSQGANTYSWSFGDGNTSTTSGSVSHTYSAYGSYSVSLTVTNTASGCSHNLAKNIIIAPIATAFSANDTTICKGDTVTFSGTSSSVISNYKWDFGNSVISNTSAATIKQRYTNAGLYTVKLVVSDTAGCKDSLTKTNYIRAGGPTVNFTGTPVNGCPGTTVNFTDATVANGGYGISQRAWTFGDATSQNTTATTLSHVYNNTGTYTVTLNVTDSNGCNGSLTRNNYIAITKPTAAFSTTDTSACLGQSISFTNSSTGNSLGSSWAFGDGLFSGITTPSHAYAATGNYDVKLVVTDANGCKDSITKASYVHINAPTISFTRSDSFAACPPLAVNLTNNSTGAVSYLWSFGNNGQSTLTNPSTVYTYPGVYNIKLIGQNAAGCKDSATRTVTIQGPTGSFSYAPLTGCTPLTVNFSATANNTSTFIWDMNNGVTNNTSSGSYSYTYTSPGQYVPRLILSDGGSCLVPIQGTDTVKADHIDADFSFPSTVYCGSGTVQFTDTVLNSLSSVSTRSWNFGDAGTSTAHNPSHTYISAGTYQVRLIITNTTGCIDTVIKYVTISAKPNVTAGTNQTICQGQSTPAPISATGAANYVWTPTIGLSCPTCVSPTALPSVTTTYIVTGTDLNGCTDTGAVTITVNPKPTATASGNQTICAGSSATLSAGGGISYVWSPATGLSCTACTNPVASPSSTTTYKVTVTGSNGCTDTANVTITVNPKPIISAGANTSVCSGDSVSLSASGGISYVWSPATGLSCTGCSNPKASPSTTTTYTVTGTGSNGCSDISQVTVTVNAKPNVTASNNQAICIGSSTTLTASGASSYSWSPATGLSCTACTNTTASPTTTTTYVVTGTAANGCTDTGIVTVTVNALPSISTGSNQVICPGGAASLSATGATSYTWSPATGLSCTACANPTASPASTTTYTVTGTNANGCVNTSNVTVTVNPRPTINTSGNATICVGSSTSISATGGVSYTWSPATGLSCTNCANPTAAPTTTTTYTVTGTGANGCTNTANLTVTVNPLPIVSAGTNRAICAGSSTTLTGTGANSYTWSPATGLSCTSCTNTIASPASTTTYTVTGTDGNGCTNTANVTVTVNALPAVSAGTNQSICPGGAAALLATGASSYTWSPASGLSCTSCANPNATPAATTTYTVTGTDANGCVNTANVTVTVKSVPTISAGSNVAICTGSSTNLLASGGVSYTWSPAAGLSCTTCANPTANPTSTTTYTVTGTGVSGCTNTSTVIVTVNPLPNVSAGANQAICAGGFATLNATGAVSYTWSPATGLSCTNCANPVATPSTTTTYTVTGTNANGCINTSTVTVTVNSLPTVSAGSNQTICPGGNVTLQATGANTYVWSPATGLSCTACANPIASPATTTTYTVTGTNGNGCSNTSAVTVTVNAQPNVSAGLNRSVCIGSSTSLLATGANTYVWSPSAGLSCTTCANPTATPAATTTYTVIGTLSTGCADTAQVVVTVNPLPTISAGGNKNICTGASVSLLASGGTSYSWSPATGLSCTACSNPTATPATTTTYTVTGTDINGCVNTANAIVTVNPIPVVTISGKDTICSGDSALLSASGAASYSWSPAGSLSCATCNGTYASPSTTTTYTITGTTNGCSSNANHKITVLSLPVVTVSPDTAICTGNTASLSANGGNTYSWTPASGLSCSNCPDPFATPSASTTYTVKGTDIYGCSADAKVKVTVHPSPVINAGQDTSLCNGLPHQLNVSGAASYTWMPGTYLSCTNCDNPVITPKADISYKIIGVDGNGCSDSTVIKISVINKGPVSFGAGDTICVGESAQLSANGGTNYVWSPATGLNNNILPNPVATPDVTTNYTVIIQQGKCFADTGTVTVLVNNNPVVNLGPDQTLVYGGSILLNAEGTDISKYEWVNTPGLSCYDCAKPTANPAQKTTYTVTVYSEWGCKATDDITIFMTCDQSEVFIANTFTPNNDGYNDRFYPQGKGLASVKRFAVYNRWGQIVYEAKDIPLNNPDFGWDGTFKSEPLKPDVFVYVLNAVCDTGDPIEIKGDISLVR